MQFIRSNLNNTLQPPFFVSKLRLHFTIRYLPVTVGVIFHSALFQERSTLTGSNQFKSFTNIHTYCMLGEWFTCQPADIEGFLVCCAVVSCFKQRLFAFVCVQVQATDADQGENGRVLYRILTGNCCLPVLLQRIASFNKCG